MSRPTIYKCIDKALAAGVMTGLRDHYHRPRMPEITEEAKAWVVSLACQKPKDLGLAAELWTVASLARYVAEHAAAAGFPRLSTAAKATVWRILDAHELKPHRVRYYLERRDTDFERKMAEVLMVYRDVNLYRADAVHDARPMPIYTVSVDEKPGVQGLGVTAPDLPPVPGKHPSVGRDHEYVRHGTLSILAALDLHSGQIIANVESRHRSVEFVALLQRLDAHYPSEAVIRVVLDNHSAHISKETMAYLGEEDRLDLVEHALGRSTQPDQARHRVGIRVVGRQIDLAARSQGVERVLEQHLGAEAHQLQQPHGFLVG